MDNKITPFPELGNNQVQDILEELGMIDENGNCPYTAEEIFKAGVLWNSFQVLKWCHENISGPSEIDDSLRDIFAGIQANVQEYLGLDQLDNNQ